jgi:hypothetical protein
VAKVLQLCDAPHALLTVDGEPVIFLSCRALPHMAYVLLVVPAADDYSISSMQAKAAWQSLMALPVPVPLEGWPLRF